MKDSPESLKLPDPDTIGPGDVIAVGDIHARYDLFSEFLDFVEGSLATVILLGDIIDRGGDDLKVLRTVEHLLNAPNDFGISNAFCLMGNHEAMFVDAMVGSGADYVLWLQNGGNFEDFAEMREHLEWLAELPVYMTVDDTMFIHAGIVPGRDPYELVDAGKVDKLLWMREPFLSQGPQFEKWNKELRQIVFGHTPKIGEGEGEPYTIPNGICIDTGAHFTNVLTAYNVSQDTFYQFTAPANAEETAHC
jgi:serine/threonine protein phosphatase 1